MVVLDASTLILLAKIDLLPVLAEKTNILITQEVEREALIKPRLYDAQIIARMLDDGRIKTSTEIPQGSSKTIENQFKIAAGEATALLLARERATALGIDDRSGIRAAKILGVPFFTAIHVVNELHEKGRIDLETAISKLEGLRKYGRYDDRTLNEVRERLKRS